ncbi:uncharacterized protein PHACADRAFT_195141 [Phanerochaete carnosa HHB-10118-sp]|uniref:Enoyl reductase (ER) domain-containing protein n=1 Tax=Phanerochaete carnosa (strain HHB-10118-sp) TaxID=650164 RepID=K5UYA9_PHACS|nr:uncharacterized protein PHACADRAFT_195141 [Phanerochaete carnosa HHB-10118-sp]EKM55116.1 hypothetical protein PHACADRAFT_195141 [Phanerochaete carnosa HHB-10118-sp]
MSNLPVCTKALVVKPSPPGRKPLYHDAVLEDQPNPQLNPGELLVKVSAAAFNHRDLWIRKGQYPVIAFGSTFGADGAGTVIAAANKNDPLLHKRVFLVPMRGWEKDPDAPESNFFILGGGNAVPIGTFRQYVAVERDQVILSPEHLNDDQIAAWPLGAVTAWRATIVNAQIKPGDNILITGIGGGVALIALQIAVAQGANVYVSSGNEEKIRKALVLGAKGGVNYKQKDWPARLGKLLVQHTGKNAQLSAVIDSAGGDIMGQVGKILKAGGKVVVYGMTASPKVNFTMREVLKNQRLLGSTMGSHQDLVDATKFLSKHRIIPVVSHVLDGLENAEEGFKILQKGDQFGKVVIRVKHDDEIRSKL